MRTFSLTIAALLFAGTSANAATIVGLCNTGQNQQCTANKGGNGAELHWELAGQNNAFTPTSINSAWLANAGASRWITPTNKGNASLDPSVDGFYIYSLTFNISQNLNPFSAQFAGRFAVDNAVERILLNGNAITGTGGTFNQWTNFGATSGFVSGDNLLQFAIRNVAQTTGNPTGLRVEFQSSSIAAVPEPATWAMMILGFGVIGGALRRRKPAVTTRVAFG